MLLQAGMHRVHVGLDGDAVRNVPETARPHAFCNPPRHPGRLQDEGLARVGEEEAVLVGPVAAVLLAAPPLPVRLQEAGADLHGLPGRAAPLQGQAQEVHAQQPRLAAELALRDGAHGLVPAHNAEFVRAHLAAPEPARLGEADRQRLPRLGYLDVRALHPGTLRVLLARDMDDLMLLLGGPVGVLAEADGQARPGGGQEDEGVARARGGPRAHFGREM
mmetsp:Transcript_119486/g.338830  ORF Transcript_119486/g.338830 Transcript_119486/m.338830 type:complete len:219 (+) Transcript_119486:337-993(+)